MSDHAAGRPRRDERQRELDRDRRAERMLLPKALLALFVVILLAYIRHRYWV